MLKNWISCARRSSFFQPPVFNPGIRIVRVENKIINPENESVSTKKIAAYNTALKIRAVYAALLRHGSQSFLDLIRVEWQFRYTKDSHPMPSGRPVGFSQVVLGWPD